MVFAMEEAEASGHIEIFQRIEHLNTFAHPAAVILVAVNEEGRGLRLIRIFQRRLLPELVMLRPHISTNCLMDKSLTNIVRVAERDPRGDAALGSGRFEAVCMADDPVSHESTV